MKTIIEIAATPLVIEFKRLEYERDLLNKSYESSIISNETYIPAYKENTTRRCLIIEMYKNLVAVNDEIPVEDVKINERNWYEDYI